MTHIFHLCADEIVTTRDTLRADAAHNRTLILDAARELFADRGLNVSMRQIALRAGVGEPTLRRRFASKEALVAEAFEDKIGTYADLANAAAEHPDPAEGLRSFLAQAMDMQQADRGFADVLTLTFPRAMQCEQNRGRAYAAVKKLIAAAQDAGALRKDFVAEDVVLALMANAGVVGAAGSLGEVMSARLQAYLFEVFGLAAKSDLPPAPRAGQVYQALLRLHEPGGD